MQWYHYNCDEFNDTGWGCVYRSFQNALYLLDYQISMRDLVRQFGSDRWIEPALLRACIPRGFNIKLLLWFAKPHFLKQMLCTTPEDYDHVVPSQNNNQLYCEIYDLAKDHVFVVDNGTYSYCIFYINGWKLLDPHVQHRSCVLKEIINLNMWLNQSSLWMVLAITRKHVHFSDVVDVILP